MGDTTIGGLSGLGTSLGSPPLTGTSMLGGGLGNGLVDASAAGVAFKQAEFERLMESADVKQAGVANFQWNLIRDQFGAFARETASIRQELAKSQAQNQESFRLVSVLQAELETEAAARVRDDQAVLGNMNQFKVAFETMDKEGHARNLKIEELARAFEAERQERSRNQTALDGRCQETLRALQIERGERAEEARIVRTAIEKEIRDREEINLALDQERNERVLMGTSLEERCAAAREHAEKCLREAREALGQERLNRESQDAALAGDLQVKEARLRSETAAFKEQLDEAIRELRREVERVAQDSDTADARLRASQDALQTAFETRLRETSAQLSDRIARAEQELRAELARAADALQAEDKRLRSDVEQLDVDLRAEIGRVQRDLDSKVADLKATNERRFALVDEAAQAEKRAREAGDLGLYDRLELLQKALKDDLRQETVNREAQELELKSGVETLKRGLSTEEQFRSDQTTALGNRALEFQQALDREKARAMARADFESEAKRLWEAVDTHTHQVQQPPAQMMVMEQVIQPATVQTGSTSVVPARAQKHESVIVTDGRPRLGSTSISPGPSNLIHVPSPVAASGQSPISPTPVARLPGSSAQAMSVRSYGGGSYGL